MQEDWRELKELFKEVRHRRGRAGAAFNISFANQESCLVFRSGSLNPEEIGSALDQIGHLTSIVGQMTRPERLVEPLVLIESVFDKKSDRWSNFRGFSLSLEKTMYIFDDSTFKWTKPITISEDLGC